jgi:DNA-binding response OmpR family regulator
MVGHILVIDDEEEIRELFYDLLTHTGHTVSLAKNGREGIEMVAKKPYDLVITDLMMPDWDGRTAIKAISAGRPGTKIIVVSAASSDICEKMEQLNSVVGVIQKPFEIDELLSLVNRSLTNTL